MNTTASPTPCTPALPGAAVPDEPLQGNAPGRSTPPPDTPQPASAPAGTLAEHSPLRMLLMASSYWPEHSPPQRRWYSLVSHLRDRGWTVSVVCPVAHYGAGPDYSAETRGRAWRRQPGFLGERIHRVPYLFLGDHRTGKLLDQLVSAAASALRGGGF